MLLYSHISCYHRLWNIYIYNNKIITLFTSTYVRFGAQSFLQIQIYKSIKNKLSITHGFVGLTFRGQPLYQNSTCYKQIGALFKTNYKLINSEEVSQVQSHWNKTIPSVISPESFPNCRLISIGFIYNLYTCITWSFMFYSKKWAYINALPISTSVLSHI